MAGHLGGLGSHGQAAPLEQQPVARGHGAEGEVRRRRGTAEGRVEVAGHQKGGVRRCPRARLAERRVQLPHARQGRGRVPLEVHVRHRHHPPALAPALALPLPLPLPLLSGRGFRGEDGHEVPAAAVILRDEPEPVAPPKGGHALRVRVVGPPLRLHHAVVARRGEEGRERGRVRRVFHLLQAQHVRSRGGHLGQEQLAAGGEVPQRRVAREEVQVLVPVHHVAVRQHVPAHHAQLILRLAERERSPALDAVFDHLRSHGTLRGYFTCEEAARDQ